MMQDENREDEMKANQRIGRFQAEIFPLFPLFHPVPPVPPPMSCDERAHDLTSEYHIVDLHLNSNRIEGF